MLAQLGIICYQCDYDMLMCFAFKIIEMLNEYMLVYIMIMTILTNKHFIEITHAFEISKLLH